MKIKCITNKVKSLPQEIVENYKISYDNFFLKEGKEYVVYALRVYLGHIWYCICDEGCDFYPIWNPSMLFELTDSRLSRYWVFSFDEENNRKVPYLSFPEWANDPYFYTELVDGNATNTHAVIFKKYKNLMDLEFPDSSIDEAAQIGDDEWLICPTCMDAWQCSNSEDALVRCPKCQKILNNPRYKNAFPPPQ
jgi:hypothetical protein